MSSILKIILIFIFVTNCSLPKSPKFWSKEKVTKINEIEIEIVEESRTAENKLDQIFKKKQILNNEFNTKLKINLNSKSINNIITNNYDNNDGRIDYQGDLKNISRFKFSKIKNFFQYSPEILFDNENLIFFDANGAIFKFDTNTDLVWKKNYYSKSEQKKSPVLIFAKNKETLIIADNIAKYYALDINTGKLLWSRKNKSPYNSQIKTFEDKFFIVDYENILRAYSIKDGTEIWKLQTDNALIRSQKKLSIVVDDRNVYFNNSLGDISAVNIKTGELLWQRPTLSLTSVDNMYSLENSEIITDNKNLYFSNNKNNFFSINVKTGSINWKQEINSSLKSILIDNYIFTVTNNGFLIITNKKSGNIIRITSLFKNKSKKFLRNKKLKDSIKPIGFLIGIKNIYLTTNKGKLYIIDILTGQTKKMLKIDNEKISQPFINNKNLYIIKANSIIKLN